MSFRRRHHWFRRLALGLAAALAVAAGNASYAFAKIDEGTLRSQSPAVVGEEVTSKAAAGTSLLALASDSSVRPDDEAARFAHSDVAAQPETSSSTTWTFERGDALILAIGTIALALGLGLALGYLRRPPLAGF